MTEGECVACPDTKRGGKENHLPQRSPRNRGDLTAENAESAEKSLHHRNLRQQSSGGLRGFATRSGTGFILARAPLCSLMQVSQAVLYARTMFRTSRQMPRTRLFPWLPARWSLER